jgi:hypothetical protein
VGVHRYPGKIVVERGDAYGDHRKSCVCGKAYEVKEWVLDGYVEFLAEK